MARDFRAAGVHIRLTAMGAEDAWRWTAGVPGGARSWQLAASGFDAAPSREAAMEAADAWVRDFARELVEGVAS